MIVNWIRAELYYPPPGPGPGHQGVCQPPQQLQPRRSENPPSKSPGPAPSVEGAAAGLRRSSKFSFHRSTTSWVEVSSPTTPTPPTPPLYTVWTVRCCTLLRWSRTFLRLFNEPFQKWFSTQSRIDFKSPNQKNCGQRSRLTSDRFIHVCVQVPLLPERLHLQLLVCVVGLAQMGARDRLDGPERNQPPAGFHRPRSPVARGNAGRVWAEFQMCESLCEACLMSWCCENRRCTAHWDWTSPRLRSSSLARPS